jgi:hypothetical protein
MKNVSKGMVLRDEAAICLQFGTERLVIVQARLITR